MPRRYLRALVAPPDRAVLRLSTTPGTRYVVEALRVWATGEGLEWSERASRGLWRREHVIEVAGSCALIDAVARSVPAHARMARVAIGVELSRSSRAAHAAAR